MLGQVLPKSTLVGLYHLQGQQHIFEGVAPGQEYQVLKGHAHRFQGVGDRLWLKVDGAAMVGIQAGNHFLCSDFTST